MNAHEDPARTALATAFRAQVAEAPPVPPRVRALAAARRPWRRTALVSAAAVLLGAVGVSFFLPRRGDASPAVLLQRAANEYLDARDAKLIVTLESEALEFLASLSKDHEPGERVFQPRFHIHAMEPDKFVFYGDPKNSEGSVSVSMPTCGFDGAQAWSYDAEKNEVSIAPPGEGSHLAGLDLSTFLSFGFVRELVDQPDGYDLADSTGPSDRRAGRRVFELTPKSRAAADAGPVWTAAVLTLDPAEDRIEKCVLDVKIGPVNLFTCTIELEDVDTGVGAAYFGWAQHVRDGAKVVEGVLKEGQEQELQQNGYAGAK